MPQLVQGSGFDLADAFSSDSELDSNIRESTRELCVQAVSEHEHGLLPVVECSDCPDEFFPTSGHRDYCERVLSIVVFDKIAQFGVAVITDGSIQTHCVTWCIQRNDDLHLVKSADFRDLSNRRRAPQALPECQFRFLNGTHDVHHVDGESDRSPVVAETAGYGLANPPCCVCRELETFAPIEFLDCPNQSEVALLYEVEKIQSAACIPFGDGDHEPEIASDELAFGVVCLPDVANEDDTLLHVDVRVTCELLFGILAALDDACQPYLILCREEIVCRYRFEVQTDRIGDRSFPCSACHTTPRRRLSATRVQRSGSYHHMASSARELYPF